MPVRFKTVHRFAEESGYSAQAIRDKISDRGRVRNGTGDHNSLPIKQIYTQIILDYKIVVYIIRSWVKQIASHRASGIRGWS